jgi:hypothetical protein
MPSIQGRPWRGQEGQAAWPPDPRDPTPYTQHIHMYMHVKKPNVERSSPGTAANESLFRLIVFQNSPPSVFSSSSLHAIESAADAGHAARLRRSVPCATGPAPLPTCPCLAPLLLDFWSWSPTESQSQISNLLSADCILYTTTYVIM